MNWRQRDTIGSRVMNQSLPNPDKNMEMNDSLIRKFESIRGAVNGNGVESINTKKSASLEKLQAKGLPSRKDEEYRYTPLSNLFTSELIDSLNAEASTADAEIPAIFDTANILVVSNGVPQLDRSSIIDNQITIQPIEGGAETELIQKTGTLSGKVNDSFVHLNSGLWSRGFLIDVPKGHIVEHPIVIHFITSDEDTAFTQPRGLINMRPDSEASIIEFYSNKSGSSISNEVIEIFAEDSARLNYFKIQDEGESDTRLDHTFVDQRKNSLVNVYTMTFNGKMIRNNLFIS